MTPELFSSQFCLYSLQRNETITRFKANTKTKNAAVLVPIVKRPSGLTLLLTQRAKHMRQHPGQISFPGGKEDSSDISLTHTALRETFEEVGINNQHITPLGWLPSFQTISNYTIYPLVGLIDNINQLTLNPDEVDHVFEVPLSYFTNRKNHHLIDPKWNNQTHKVHFIPYQDKLIWGATAAIIDQLILHFE